VYTEAFPWGPEPYLAEEDPEPYSPKSPPIDPEVAEELERVRRDKEEAIEEQRFPEAAELRIESAGS
jgi:hypothetical protein